MKTTFFTTLFKTISCILFARPTAFSRIIGVEPGIKPAIENSKTGVIGILATECTLQSESFLSLSNRFESTVKIEVQSCPGLVEQVENLDLVSEYTRKLAHQYIQPLMDKGVDTLVLGCTHYPFLDPLIKEIAGEHILVIDTGYAVAKEVKRRLVNENLLSTSSNIGNDRFYTSGDQYKAEETMNKLWGSPIIVSPLPKYYYSSTASSFSVSTLRSPEPAS